jgi:hypothetical protein
VHRRGETFARYAGKFDNDLVAAVRESQTGVHRNGRRPKEWKQDRFPERADQVKQLCLGQKMVVAALPPISLLRS